MNTIGGMHVRVVLVLEIELNQLFRSNSCSLFAWLFCATDETLKHQIETKIFFPNGLHNPFLKDVKRNL